MHIFNIAKKLVNSYFDNQPNNLKVNKNDVIDQINGITDEKKSIS